jgi:hypothetical protein
VNPPVGRYKYYIAKRQKTKLIGGVGIVKAPFKSIRNPDGVARGGPEVHIMRCE